MLTGRSTSAERRRHNTAYGVDGTLRSSTTCDQHLLGADRSTDRRGGTTTRAIARSSITRATGTACSSSASSSATNFNPEVGFVRRADMRRQLRAASLQPAAASRAGRSASSHGPARWRTSRTARAGSRRATRTANSPSSSRTATGSAVSYGDTYEFLPRRFAIAPGITLPVGGYDYDDVRVQLQLRPAAAGVAATCRVERGTFYNGHKTTVGVSRGPGELHAAAVGRADAISVNWVDLAEGSFTTHLVGSRVTYTMTPLMFMSALLQYNSSSHAVRERAAALGVSPGQRAVRRVQRAARHARAAASRLSPTGRSSSRSIGCFGPRSFLDDDVASETQRRGENTGSRRSRPLSNTRTRTPRRNRRRSYRLDCR